MVIHQPVKTTLVEAACSVWEEKTINVAGGLRLMVWKEPLMMFNDTLLALDEISECAPQEVGNIIYSLGKWCR
ncbi:DUF927 domain-containing protein [Budvicia aquatica]|uniref:Superfamily II helicase and inactivated derivatives n=1 Tax=Budvicia aquatica TaxID=82979 RepID=A0A484ZK95_9GAMM|nr:Superfamily II helicase and inactivated derivatives [Budvicia aquatica]